MYFTASGMPIIEEEDVIAEIPREHVRPGSHWEGMHGLGIQGFDNYHETCSIDRDPSVLKRRTSSRRSLMSLDSRSTDSQYSERHSLETAYISISNYEMSPISTATSSPTSASNSGSTSPEPLEPNPEDLTTYHANLARFRIERAERVAELGLCNYDLSETDFSWFMKSQAREEQRRKVSSRTIGKGLRAYWGGGSSVSLDSKTGRGSTRLLLDPYWDAQADRAALKAWWDRLGN